VTQTPVPRWYSPLQESIASTVRGLRRALDRADALGPNEVQRHITVAKERGRYAGPTDPVEYLRSHAGAVDVAGMLSLS
jgi:hypothetical protein